MNWAIYGAFFFTVALLFFTAYFLLGGLPLLILKHDAPLDAKFVRAFFNVYYRVAFWAALGAAASYALWGRFAFAAGAVVIAGVVTLMRKYLLGAMEQAGTQIEGSDDAPIRRFRRMHGAALLINLALLVFLVWGTIQLSRSL
jgi:4-amino-4-deoxy-L-arabinose transferase-like glycosyltransferase